MESLIREQKEAITLSTHPFYFGHYLNMARHNAYLILVHLSEKHGFNYPPEQEDKEPDLLQFEILNFYDQRKNRPEELMAIKEDLLWYFPLLRSIKKESDFSEQTKEPRKKKAANAPAFEKSSAYGKVLRMLFACMNDLRNRYNHSYYLKEWGHDIDLNLIFNCAIDEAKRRMGTVIPASEFEHLENHKGKPFFYFMKEKDYKTFTEKGVVFFTCLFLEKKYAFRFLSRLEHFHKTETPWARATLKTFTEHCVNLPKEKLQSSDIKLDMLNELDRCPAELYFLLSDEDQKGFKQDVVNNLTDIDDDEYKSLVSMKRHNDRFPYFALNYFERSGIDPRLHFQTKLGKVLTQNIYPETILGEKRDRRIIKTANTLGAPSNYQATAAPAHWYNIKKASEKGGQKQATKAGEIDQYSPQYRMVGERIGLIIDPEFVIPTWPDLKKGTNKKGNPVCKVDNPAPAAILSTYELQNLFVYTWLHSVEKKPIKSPSEFIDEYKTNFKRFYSDLCNGTLQRVSGETIVKEANRDVTSTDWEQRKIELTEKLAEYGLKESYLPDDLKNYLLRITEQPRKEQVLSKVSAMLKQSKEYASIALKMIAREPLEKGEHIQTGEMAQLLASDIVFLTPHNKTKNNKPNNLEYDVLQNSLAFFSINRDKLSRLFIELGFTDYNREEKHPFLKEIKLNDCRGILDFFNAYYCAKVKWLKQLQRDLDSEHFKVYFKNVKEIFDIGKSSALNKKYKETIFLPRGLFNTPIAEALGMEDGLAISSYLDALKGFGNYSQPFYQLKRFYLKNREEEFPSLKDTGVPKDLVGQIIEEISKVDDPAEKKKLVALRKEILENEKIIRYRQSTDRALWLMVYQLFANDNENTDGSAKLKLKLDSLTELGFDQKESDFFRKEYPFTYIIENKETGKQLAVTETMQIKRYGDFRRFFRDRRLKDLILYFDKTTVERSELIKEIDDYENGREELMQKIYRFEELLNKEPYGQLIPIKSENEGKTKFRNHRSYLDFAKEQFNLNDEVSRVESEEFRFLRNKIMHNQIPVAPWLISEVKNGSEELSITTRLLNLIGDTYDKMISAVEKEKVMAL